MESGDEELCHLDETIPPCRECEKHFFHQQQTFNWLEAGVVLISILTLVTDLVTGETNFTHSLVNTFLIQYRNTCW